MQRRRPLRSTTRAEHWVEQIRDAANGRDALKKASDWLLSELQSTREVQHGRADSACWEMALNTGLYAARLRRAHIKKRTGLTAAEVARLLDPWGQDAEEGERQ